METEVKRLDLSKSTFEANGVKYRFSSNMCIDRFIEFERLQAHVGFGKDFQNMYTVLKDTYELLNKGKLADASVKIHNLIQGIATNLDKRDHPILEMCALFINREDEDVKTYDEDVMKQKIEDWRKEGYSIEDFFQLAFNFVEGFIPAYNEIIQDISDKAEEMVKTTSGKES